MPIAGVATNFGKSKDDAMDGMYAPPGLRPTPPQVERLWNLDAVTAESVMTAIMDVQFVRRTPRGAYVLADLG
jgi:hypothetical protein